MSLSDILGADQGAPEPPKPNRGDVPQQPTTPLGSVTTRKVSPSMTDEERRRNAELLAAQPQPVETVKTPKGFESRIHHAPTFEDVVDIPGDSRELTPDDLAALPDDDFFRAFKLRVLNKDEEVDDPFSKPVDERPDPFADPAQPEPEPEPVVEVAPVPAQPEPVEAAPAQPEPEPKPAQQEPVAEVEPVPAQPEPEPEPEPVTAEPQPEPVSTEVPLWERDGGDPFAQSQRDEETADRMAELERQAKEAEQRAAEAERRMQTMQSLGDVEAPRMLEDEPVPFDGYEDEEPSRGPRFNAGGFQQYIEQGKRLVQRYPKVILSAAAALVVAGLLFLLPSPGSPETKPVVAQDTNPPVAVEDEPEPQADPSVHKVAVTPVADCGSGQSSARNMLDNKTETAWVCPRKTGRDGKLFQLTFPYTVELTQVQFIPGYDHVTPSKDFYHKYRVPSKVAFIMGEQTTIAQCAGRGLCTVDFPPNKFVGKQLTVRVLQTMLPVNNNGDLVEDVNCPTAVMCGGDAEADKAFAITELSVYGIRKG